MRIGVVSDTHGRMHPRVAEVLAGVDHIVHAGDVRDLDDLAALRSIAPVTAVAGNCDKGRETGAILKKVESFTIAGVRVSVVHELSDLPSGGRAADLIVHGHTHRCEVVQRDGRVWLNPGTATWPGDRAEPTVAVAVLDDGRVSASIVEL